MVGLTKNIVLCLWLPLGVGFVASCSRSSVSRSKDSEQAVATECTALAGGDKYRDFYLVICGYD
jgi:hypothetical protein